MPDYICRYLKSFFLLAQVFRLLAKMYHLFTIDDAQMHFLWLLSVG